MYLCDSMRLFHLAMNYTIDAQLLRDGCHAYTVGKMILIYCCLSMPAAMESQFRAKIYTVVL